GEETGGDGFASRSTHLCEVRYQLRGFYRDKDGWNYFLQPVEKIHLYSRNEGNRAGPVSDIRYVYIFGAVGLFVILLAVINFVNLTTARATKRAKEVGVKKVL